MTESTNIQHPFIVNNIGNVIGSDVIKLNMYPPTLCCKNKSHSSGVQTSQLVAFVKYVNIGASVVVVVVGSVVVVVVGSVVVVVTGIVVVVVIGIIVVVVVCITFITHVL